MITYAKRESTRNISLNDMRLSEIAHPRNTSNKLVVTIGTGIVAFTLAISVFGVHATISAMDAKTTQVRSQYSQRLYHEQAAVQSKDIANSQNAGAKTFWESKQLDWMKSNHITWNDAGFPVNEKGDVVDDPTTSVNEIERYTSQTQNASVHTSTQEISSDASNVPPETSPWYAGNDKVSVAEDGSAYYVVQSGDNLTMIAKMTGFTVPELADYNNLVNISLIEPNQKIFFPPDGPSVVDKSLGLG